MMENFISKLFFTIVLILLIILFYIAITIKKKREERKKKKREIINRYHSLSFKNTKNNKTIGGINQSKKGTVKEVLEDMSVLGSIMKEEIIEEKYIYPKKFISIEEATKEENKNFCLGILAKNLENMGIITAIEKNPSEDVDDQEISKILLQFITSGMLQKPKLDFHFDFGEKRNNELLTNNNEQEKFNNTLKKKLSIEYNIPEDKIIIINAQRGSYKVQVIFETEEFNQKDIDINKFKNNCTEEEFKELKCLKEIQEGLIIEGCKLDPNMLDSRGNKESEWKENEKRGGYPYIPPKGWKGYGLKVMDVYDNGNNDWIAKDGNPNEWAVAYHGIGYKLGSTVEDATRLIFMGGFKAGGGQVYKGYYNDNPKYKCDDIEHDYSKKIGIGVYCSPDPKVMELYAKESKPIKANGKQYLMGFMMRVKPDKIRFFHLKKDYWVLDGTKDQMRPYRIMIKDKNSTFL